MLPTCRFRPSHTRHAAAPPPTTPAAPRLGQRHQGRWTLRLWTTLLSRRPPQRPRRTPSRSGRDTVQRRHRLTIINGHQRQTDSVQLHAVRTCCGFTLGTHVQRRAKGAVATFAAALPALHQCAALAQGHPLSGPAVAVVAVATTGTFTIPQAPAAASRTITSSVWGPLDVRAASVQRREQLRPGRAPGARNQAASCPCATASSSTSPSGRPPRRCRIGFTYHQAVGSPTCSW